MDFFYVSILSFIVLVSSFCLQVFLYKYKPRDHEKALPPGSTGWPIIGESIEFFTTGWKGHPEKFIFDRMSKFSPTVFKTSLLLEHVAVFCGAQGNKFLFSNENKLVQGWWPSSVKKIFPATHYNSKGHEDQALKMRNQLLPNFLNPEALHRYVPIMDAVTHHHFATNWDGKKQVVTYELTKDLTFFLACKIFFSIDDPERARYLSRPFQSIIYGIISIPINLPGTAFSRAIKAAKSLTKQLIAIIKQRKFDLARGKATPTQDVLSHMLLFEDEDGMFMEEHEIADRIIAVLLRAHDTITSASTFIVRYLAELPEIYNQVYKEQMEIAKSKAAGELLTWEDLSKMKYSWNVACEVLRIVPPIQGAFKEAITDFMYDGFSIPKGWKLYWSANSTHKNPELFPEPQKFDPSRFEGSGPAPYTFVPFGGGPRLCPGKEYARLVILVFMHHLVRKYKFEKVIPNEEIVVNLIPSLAKGLPIRLYPHKA